MTDRILLAGLICGLLACGARVRPEDSAAALDGFRALHFALCLETAPANPAACERAYQRLRALEPDIEDALAARGTWAALRRWAEPVARGLAQSYLPWLVPVLWPAGRGEA